MQLHFMWWTHTHCWCVYHDSFIRAYNIHGMRYACRVIYTYSIRAYNIHSMRYAWRVIYTYSIRAYNIHSMRYAWRVIYTYSLTHEVHIRAHSYLWHTSVVKYIWYAYYVIHMSRDIHILTHSWGTLHELFIGVTYLSGNIHIIYIFCDVHIMWYTHMDSFMSYLSRPVHTCI